jgi:hypothetical protein
VVNQVAQTAKKVVDVGEFGKLTKQTGKSRHHIPAQSATGTKKALP